MQRTEILVIGANQFATTLADYLGNLAIPVRMNCPTQALTEEDMADYIFIQVDTIYCLSDASIAVLREWHKKGKVITVNVDGETVEAIQDRWNILVLGMNIGYPMKSSLFLEIVKSKRNTTAQVTALWNYGRDVLHLDPYVCDNVSIRTNLLAAMAREAFYLVDQGYADVESIDRACRNDAGYYLPFTGNLMYMDLMGTMAYALVMKDLNPELSTESSLPSWFTEKIETGNCGMAAGAGLHSYMAGDKALWDELMDEFSQEIGELIHKYKQHYTY